MTASISPIRPMTIAQVPPRVDPKGTSFARPGVPTALAKANVAGKTTSPAFSASQARIVNSVFGQIQGSFKDSTVWKSELETAAQNIKSLDATERRWLVDKLAVTKQGDGTLLSKFMGEVAEPGVNAWGGLDDKPKIGLFRDLISGNSGTNIARIQLALGKANTESGNAAQQQFSNLATDAAKPLQKLDAIKSLIKSIGTDKNDKSAAFVATLIGSFKSPAVMNMALSQLDRVTLDRVVKGSVKFDVFSDYGGGGTYYSADARTYSKLANAVAEGGSLKTKASFMAASGPVLKDLTAVDRTQLPRVVKGMTDVLGTDTNGVMAETMALSGFSQKTGKDNKQLGQYASDGLKAMNFFNQALMATGQDKTIRVILGQLRSGNNLQANALTRINGDVNLARRLGLYTGTVMAAIDTKTSAGTRNTVLDAIFGGTVADLTKEVLALNPAWKKAATAAKFLAPAGKAFIALNALQSNGDKTSGGRAAAEQMMYIAKPQSPEGKTLNAISSTAFENAARNTQQGAR